MLATAHVLLGSSICFPSWTSPVRPRSPALESGGAATFSPAALAAALNGSALVPAPVPLAGRFKRCAAWTRTLTSTGPATIRSVRAEAEGLEALDPDPGRARGRASPLEAAVSAERRGRARARLPEGGRDADAPERAESVLDCPSFGCADATGSSASTPEGSR